MIAVDWGTSNLRCYRLDAKGAVLEMRAAAKGILAVPGGKFLDVLEEQVGDWIGQGESPVVMSGMVGSRQGWVEVPYVPCPAGYAEIAAAMRKVRDGVWVVPGVSCRDGAGVPDVMRGEEVQILGAGSDGMFCLPGTHSKWVNVEGDRITRFSTHMTGELYALLKQHSILGRMMEEEASDTNAFAQGVTRSGEDGGLLHHLFGVRTRALMGEFGPAASASYLSGILIGHELRAAGGKTVSFLGAPGLVAHYEAAASLLGIEGRALDPDAAARGLFRLGGMLR